MYEGRTPMRPREDCRWDPRHHLPHCAALVPAFQYLPLPINYALLRLVPLVRDTLSKVSRRATHHESFEATLL
ncbi:hypothetical protein RSAG8_07359, partial [Rhizoctonia solani AG-8 WAC10335]